MAIAARTPSADAPIADNDNHKPTGRHEWPARDRLRACRLMRTPDANRAALCALLRFRSDLDAVAGAEYWASFGEDAGTDQDTGWGWNPDMIRERVTAEHLVAMHMAGSLEYRTVDGNREVVERDGCRVYNIEDRLRGEKGPASPKHPPEVAAELAGRYSGAAWPRGTSKPADLFLGAQMRRCAEGRAAASPEDRLLRSAFAKRVLAYVKGGMPTALYDALVAAADGATAEAIGESRGHNGKYATAVGTEMMRLALEALVEIYNEYDGTAAS